MHEQYTSQRPPASARAKPNTPPGATQKVGTQPPRSRREEETQADDEEEEGEVVERDGQEGASNATFTKEMPLLSIWEAMGLKDVGLPPPQWQSSEFGPSSAIAVSALLGRNVHVRDEDVHVPVCPYDLRGKCNDHLCKLQHMSSNVKLSGRMSCTSYEAPKLPLYFSPTLGTEQILLASEPLHFGNPSFITNRRSTSAARAAERGRYHEDESRGSNSLSHDFENITISQVLHAALDKVLVVY